MSWIAACERTQLRRAPARTLRAPARALWRSMSSSRSGADPEPSAVLDADLDATTGRDAASAASAGSASTADSTQASGSSETDATSPAAALAAMREAIKSSSFANPESAQMSPEMRTKLAQEFDAFLADFVHSVDPAQHTAELVAEQVSGIDVSAFTRIATPGAADGNLSGRTKFPSLVQTEPSEPYSSAEMYVRQLFHARQLHGRGATIQDVFRPHETLNKPRSIGETGVTQLLAAGAHLGHATSRLRANCSPYIYGVREGIHIIDLQQTLAALRRVSRVVEELSRKGGLVLFVGTRPDQERTVERAAQRAKGFYVHKRWVPGTFTNYQTLTSQKTKVERAELDMADEPTHRQLSPSLADTIIKPDLAVVLNPVENRAMLQECIKMRIPTAGIVDTDSEPSLLTYPVPGNDDSLRFADLVAGVLSRAAERGRAVRVAEFRRLQATKQALRTGEAAQNAPAAPPRNLADVSDVEKKLL